MLSEAQKTFFMAGVISGLTIAHEEDCVLNKGKRPLPFFCETAPPVELTDFLDTFYKEPENRLIRASGAIKVMMLMSRGKTPGTIMEQILIERELARTASKKK